MPVAGKSQPAAFRVLGPLEVVVDGAVVPVPAPKQRTILAALLLRANRTVSVNELVDALWDHDAPQDARGAVQKYVMRVRRLLHAAGAGEVIRTEPDGYRIVVLPGQLDLDRFAELSAAAARAGADGDAAGESATLAEALGLWRAVPPLSDVPSTALQRYEVTGLVERHLHALDRRIDADLRMGRHADLVVELTELTRRYPERERLRAQRMRALHRAGRQGEALAAYREGVRYLAEELGVDPGPELQAAHREILTARGAAAREGEGSDPAPVAALLPVRQLPHPGTGFAGREAELAWVVAALDGTAPVLIRGAAAVGKTALAVRAAHQVAERFPDGQLFADLRGFAAAAPRDAEDVLARFLRTLGVPADRLPPTREERILTYRSLLADRRVLVVLDDAAGAEHVRALVPGTPGSAVLVTSRDDLAGLTVFPGVRRLCLDPLTTVQSRRVLTALLGARRLEAEPAATAELVRMCGGFPLALRVAAAQLIQRPQLPVADYVARLRSEGPVPTLRIDGDERADLAAAFDGSYRLLTPHHRRLLHLLTRVPVGDVTAAVAARLAGVAEADAAAALDALASMSLLERLPAGRFRMHDLVRGYIRSRRENALAVVAARQQHGWLRVFEGLLEADAAS